MKLFYTKSEYQKMVNTYELVIKDSTKNWEVTFETCNNLTLDIIKQKNQQIKDLEKQVELLRSFNLAIKD